MPRPTRKRVRKSPYRKAGVIKPAKKRERVRPPPIRQYVTRSVEHHRKAHIFKLPNEILFQIFSYFDAFTLLARISRVCKSWMNLVDDPFFWSGFKTLNFENNEDSTYIIKILERCYKLQHLKIARTGRRFNCDRELLCQHVFHTFTHLHELRSLTLSGFKVNAASDEFFRLFVQRAEHLTHLTFDKCFITSEFAESISEAKSLNYLCLSRCYSIENHSFMKIMEKCQQLEHLNLSQQDTLNDKVFGALFHYRSGNLKSLILRDVAVKHHNFLHVQKCKNLTALTVDCHFLQDKALKYVSKIPNLHHLELPYGLLFSSYGLKRLFVEGNFSNLSRLDLTCCGFLENANLMIIAERCPDLVSLDLAECWRVSDVGILHLIRKCSKLYFLNLEDLKELKGYFLKGLTFYLKSIKLLNLCFCDGISPSVIKNFLQMNPSFKVKKCEDYRMKPVLNPNFQPLLLVSCDLEM